MDEMRDYLTEMANRQVLKYAAGKQIFCPVKGCGKILDYKKTVLIEFEFAKGGSSTLIMCRKCFDSEAVQAQVERWKQYIKEITKY